ncbi:hypothetical protein BD289DRAFT_480368 [Coniella lustricola]|uniref:Uncharacterized protein n=1 Tax=Coniella lustricola TaxID=2025994 RepID=A0A2T3AFW8_9PEZI|nr:hypothetical protein BD289DRAFT_480368 [Coniella lustricola]
MSIASSDGSSASSRTRSRDTGFPESFCGNRNTSLPHPDADTSGNACITQEDISVSRVMSRQRHSFLNKYNKRTISHGYITPETEQMSRTAAAVAHLDSDMSASDEKLPTMNRAPELEQQRCRPTSGGAQSYSSTSTADNEDAAPQPTRHDRPSRDNGAETQSRSDRRKRIFGKFGIHRHHDH